MQYVVKKGDCVHDIAARHGLFWETVWDHPDNAALKSERSDPGMLVPGDLLHVPEKRLRQESGATDSTHRFVRKGVPAQLKLRIMRPVEQEPEPGQALEYDDDAEVSETEDPEAQPREEEPWANAKYTLNLDGEISSGQTDADGYLTLRIRPQARACRLVMEAGTQEEREILVRLGELAPPSTPSGALQRLNNLGYAADENGGNAPELDAEAQVAVLAFQHDQELDPTGELDQATIDRLEQLHES